MFFGTKILGLIQFNYSKMFIHSQIWNWKKKFFFKKWVKITNSCVWIFVSIQLFCFLRYVLIIWSEFGASAILLWKKIFLTILKLATSKFELKWLTPKIKILTLKFWIDLKWKEVGNFKNLKKKNVFWNKNIGFNSI